MGALLRGSLLVAAVLQDTRLVGSLAAQQDARFLAGVSTSATSGQRWKVEKTRTFDGVIGITNVDRPHWPRPRLTCARAAVCTTINVLTAPIELVANASDWCLIIVGDAITPEKEYRNLARQKPDSVVYLSLEDQHKLPYETAKAMPERHFGRKNVGYIYAVHAGATQIFDFDDDNALLAPTSLDGLTPSTPVRLALGKGPVNPYLWFGAPKAWPRGLPLDSLNSNNATIGPKTSVTLGAIQGLAQHDPDVDAIYRLAPRSALALPFFFETKSVKENLIALSPQTMAPFNAQATLWFHGAFAALYLPTTVHGRVSDIWRSYVTQAAFRCQGLSLAFSPPVVEQDRNAHDYMADFMSERPLYEEAGALVAYLGAWACPADKSLASAVEHLFVDMYERGFLEVQDVGRVQAFLRDLVHVAGGPAHARHRGRGGRRSGGRA